MVAFATEGSLFRTLGTPTTEAPERRNRARGIFLAVEVRVGENGLESRFPSREKAAFSYETASGPTNFLNRDPIEEFGGANLYAFVGNDPVNRWDYLGLQWWWPPSWFGGDDNTIDGEEIISSREFASDEPWFHEWNETDARHSNVYVVDFEIEVEGKTEYRDCCTGEIKEAEDNLYYGGTIDGAYGDDPLYTRIEVKYFIPITKHNLIGLVADLLMPQPPALMSVDDQRYVFARLRREVPAAPSEWHWREIEFSGCE